MLTELRKCGLNVVRMNFSHGSYEYHGEVIANARKSFEEEPLDGRLLAIALDTKGPEIRTGMTKDGGNVELHKGGTITVSVDPAHKDACDAHLVYMDYANLPKVMSVGGIIFVDDGLLGLKVSSIDVEGCSLACEILNSGMLGSKKGCNLPEVDVDLPALSEKDKADLAFGVEQNVDMIFASFIRKAQDVRDVRARLVECDPVVGGRIRIISKIENHEGMRNFDEILAETDGVMVARGDLGIEIPSEKVFLAQKMMIAKCNIAGKPVICATQMLESMTSNPRPTRAEASDVANAVLDGADCVMLSGETAKGSYPREAVTMMAQVCLEAEAAAYIKAVAADMKASLPHPLSLNDSVAKSVVDAATTHGAKLIITPTSSGASARLISKFRPRCPILVLARDAHVGAAANLNRGCLPFFYPHAKQADGEDVPARFAYAMNIAKALALAAEGDTVCFAYGWQTGVASLANFRMVTVGAPFENTFLATPPSLLALCNFTATEARGHRANTLTELTSIEEILPSANKLASHQGMQAAAQDSPTDLLHKAALDIYSEPAKLRGSSIICTIGPKTKSVEMLTELRKCGLNVVRMNFSHGSYEYHGEVIANARKSFEEEPLDGRLLAIALDTKGPEIRTGMTKDGGNVELHKGGTITVSVDPAHKDACDAHLVYMDYANLPKVMSVGGIIFVDDGLLGLKVSSIDVEGCSLACEILNSGMLGSKKGCNLPEVDVDLPALSEKDKADLAFGVEQNVDMIFASFIRKAQDVRDVRARLVECDPVVGGRIRIISKIENHEGMRNFDEILAETDGVMVARGDLGIEIPSEKVFLAQKMMIAKCNIAGKPVICATQMLESMTSNPRPTRAEASDVANAVLDGADCVMLSGETAKGSYPREAVTMMAQVCREAESAIYQKAYTAGLNSLALLPLGSSDAVAAAVVEAASNAGAKLICTLTATGTSAKLIAKYRPRCPILVLASDSNIGAALHLHRGCFPFFYPHERVPGDEDERFAYAITLAKGTGLISSGDMIVLAHGWRSGTSSLNSFRLVRLS